MCGLIPLRCISRWITTVYDERCSWHEREKGSGCGHPRSDSTSKAKIYQKCYIHEVPTNTENIVEDRGGGITIQGGALWIAVILMLSSMVGISLGKTGYTVDVSVGGTAWQISRFAENMSFNNYENISGAGNFSRYNHVNGISDFGFTEKSSVVRGGDLSLDQRTRFFSREGPVAVSYALSSVASGTTSNLTESAKVTIDEVWPFYFVNYKKLHYVGHGIRNPIRNSEVYDNNGNVITTSSDSYSLQKESVYSSYNNRTLITTTVYPYSVVVDRASNKSSSYVLTLKSIGSLSSLDVIEGRPSDESGNKLTDEAAARITQDYRGLVNMNLKIASKQNVPVSRYVPVSDEDGAYVSYFNTADSFADYLPCCMDGYSGLSKFDREHLSADCIFDSYSANVAIPQSSSTESLSASKSLAVREPAVAAETDAASSIQQRMAVKRPSETKAKAEQANETSKVVAPTVKPALKTVSPAPRAAEESPVSNTPPPAGPGEDRYYEEMRAE